MTENALDPPPAKRARTGRRIVAIVIGVIVAAGVIFALDRMVFQHPAGRAGMDRAAFARGRGPMPNPPPAVAPAVAAATRANIRAAQRAAESPALVAHPVQVASVSPPAGPPPSGIGVTRSGTSVGPAAG